MHHLPSPPLRCLAAAVLLALAAPSVATARTWSYSGGVSFEGEFVRLAGETAWFFTDEGETVSAPLSALAPADRDWVRRFVEAEEPRDWSTRDGRKLRGGLVEIVDGRVTLKTTTGEELIAVEDLSDADRDFLQPLLTESAEPPAPSSGTASSSGGRTWTDNRGREIVAEYRRLEGDRVVLFLKGREYRVALADLSLSDRRFVLQRVAEAQGRRPPPPPVAEAPPVSRDTPPAPSGGYRPPPAVAENHAVSPGVLAMTPDQLKNWRLEARNGSQRVWVNGKEYFGADADYLATLIEQRESQRASENEQRQNRIAQERRDSEAKRQEEHRSRTEQRERNRERFAAAPPRRPRAPNRTATPETYGYQCFSCNHTWESPREYHAGDRCPRCRVTFDRMNDENGNVVEETSTGKASRYARLGKLAVFAFIGLASLFGWLSKKK